MAIEQFNQTPSYAARSSVTFDEGLRQHMLSIYNYMTVALGITGLVAWLVASSPALTHLFLGTPLSFVVMLAPLGFVFFGFNPTRLTAAQMKIRLFIFSALMGLSMAAIFLVFAKATIARAFFVTAGTFAATSLYGYSTKRDLTGIGSFMFMGLFGLIIASVVNIFLHSNGLSFVLSIMGVVIFTGLIAWDSQRLKEQYAASYGIEANGKLAVMGALSLYLNFINLFQFMLRLMSNSRN